MRRFATHPATIITALVLMLVAAIVGAMFAMAAEQRACEASGGTYMVETTPTVECDPTTNSVVTGTEVSTWCE